MPLGISYSSIARLTNDWTEGEERAREISLNNSPNFPNAAIVASYILSALIKAAFPARAMFLR